MAVDVQPGRRHTYLKGPWHNCGICDFPCKIAEMTWQRGVLRCPDCVEKPQPRPFPLLGQREIAIAAVLEDGKEELAPVEKLRNPDVYTAEEDFNI